MFADDTQHQERARKTLRPMLASLCTRERVGALSSAAENVISAGNAVVLSATTFNSLTMARARTGKDDPTVQLRDIQAAVRIAAVRPSTDAATYLLMSFPGKHADRKRFNRKRYEEQKAERLLPKEERKSFKRKLKKNAEATVDDEGEAPAAASPAKATRKRGRKEE